MAYRNVQAVLAENLGEGYRIVFENGELSPVIEWVEWILLSDKEDDVQVAVTFDDDSEMSFAKGVLLNQIWYEDVI